MTTSLKKLFKGKRVLLIGDPMIDGYMWGKSTRLSPEAPVPVIDIEKTEERLGGAANVALNLKALGAEPLLVAATGNSPSGKRFKHLMKKADLSIEGLFEDGERTIPIKTRIINNNQHVLRVDEETIVPVGDEKALIAHAKSLLYKEDFNVVIFQDYNKGLLSERIIGELTTLSNTLNIPTVVDPKKDNFFSYKNVSLFKPNLKELSEGLQEEIIPNNEKAIASALEKTRSRLNATAVMVTLSEYGIAFATSEQFESQRAYQRKIIDVSGAGDSVVSVAALALASGCSWSEIAGLANLAGGLVCEKVGVVPIQIDWLEKAFSERQKAKRI